MPTQSAVGAAGALLRYLHELQPRACRTSRVRWWSAPGGAMPLDGMTRRNLELVESMRGGDRGGTLLTCSTARTRQWAPACCGVVAHAVDGAVAIDARLDAVGALVDDALARDDAAHRARWRARRGAAASKAAAGRATPRELGALGASLARLPAVEAAARRVGTRA